MYDKGRPVGFAAVADPAEVEAGEDRTDSLQFGLADVQKHEGQHLDNDSCFLEFVLQPEEQKSAENIFPACQ